MDYSWFKMLCFKCATKWISHYIYIYISILFHIFSPCRLLQTIEFPVLYSRSLLIIYFLKKLFIYLFLATPVAYASSQVGIESELSYNLCCSCRNTGSFNSLLWAGDWTPAATQGTAVRFLTYCATAETFNYVSLYIAVYIYKSQTPTLFLPPTFPLW